jgi:MoaA/NifB/PqqE/SkfB family radical SAM enzyme
MYKVTSRWPHQDTIKVEWNLGKRCNYDCTYCPESIHDNSSSHTDIELLKHAADQLMRLGKPIRLSFTGGEPTVHPQFTELLNYCKHIGIEWISVTTNGTRTAKWYADQRVNQYVFSLHFEYDYSRVITTIINTTKLWSEPKTIMVHVMAHHEHMDAVRDTVGYLELMKVPYAIRRVRWTEGDHDLFDDMRYAPDDLSWIKEKNSTVGANTVVTYQDREALYHANDIIKLHLNKYKDWSCNAGIESLMINWDGEVHRATCRVGGSLGYLYTLDGQTGGLFRPPTEPVTCDRNFCTCAADIPLTKWIESELS